MKTQSIARFLVMAAAVALPALASARDPARTIDSSSAVLKEFLDLQVKQIPAGLLADAHGVAIVPNVIKVGLVVGGQRGHGVVIVREKDGSWRAPTFMTLTGGSIGWQIGAQATDFVLVFKTEKSVEGLLKGKFTIGADAAAAAGPVGRRAGASTDGELKAEIYTYSRTRGLFAGVSLDGSVIEIDNDANGAYYGAVRPGEPVQAAPQAAVALTQVVAQLAANPELIEGRPVPDPATSGPLPTPALPRNSLEGPALGPALPSPSQPTLSQPLPAQPTTIRPLPGRALAHRSCPLRVVSRHLICRHPDSLWPTRPTCSASWPARPGSSRCSSIKTGSATWNCRTKCFAKASARRRRNSRPRPIGLTRWRPTRVTRRSSSGPSSRRRWASCTPIWTRSMPATRRN